VAPQLAHSSSAKRRPLAFFIEMLPFVMTCSPFSGRG
jgi:hypothetical protein